MRQIKFRVWDTKNKKMFYTDKDIYLKLFNDGSGSLVDYSQREDEDVCEIWKENPLMQFTGLLDKNGKEIYEGDIVNLYDYRDTILNTIEVKYEAPYFNIPKAEMYIEILGNIYEHPHLLNNQ